MKMIKLELIIVIFTLMFFIVIFIIGITSSNDMIKQVGDDGKFCEYEGGIFERPDSCFIKEGNSYVKYEVKEIEGKRFLIR